MRRTLPEPDRVVAERESVTFAADGAEALAQGPAPAVHELALYGRPLTLDLTAVTTPTVLLHDDADRNVPVGVARWLASQLPIATPDSAPGAGYLFLFEDPTPLLHLVSR